MNDFAKKSKSTCEINCQVKLDGTKSSAIAELEIKQKIRNIKVSTEDSEVKKQLRKIGEPICFFGEGPPERRERLKRIYALMDVEELIQIQNGDIVKPNNNITNQTWFHNGSTELMKSRKLISKYSLKRAKYRNRKLRDIAKMKDSEISVILNKQQNILTNLHLECSQIADSRPISSCQFSPDGDYLATSSWSGLAKIWSYPDCTEIRTLKGHRDRIGKIVFNPNFKSIRPEKLALATCDHSGLIKLWDFESSECIDTITGHEPYRVSSIQFHPSSQYLSTTCYDRSWRLIDLETKKELLHQEGHSREVHCSEFHPDGSLICTGSFDSYGRLWDLRTGRCIMFLDGHLKTILSIAISPNGYTLATGSADNLVKIWDLRKRSSIYTIPVHNSNVSRVKFYSYLGSYLVTSSYDKSMKIWSGNNWICLQEINGHEDRIIDFDIAPDDKSIVSVSFDRTFKVWKPIL
ncbi:hypothetical protein A3Q56_01232 [Intoshia linei]|uniref:Pre-mRNA processing factor 4 (PRP4)-like domain-containing protein n=1 Tax=Intoshia linei TaxID=1819745 RepID=A0A177B9V2_9BILA|nr:hypothetical protein A3Q56_01232 [Intoshia linei]